MNYFIAIISPFLFLLMGIKSYANTVAPKNYVVNGDFETGLTNVVCHSSVSKSVVTGSSAIEGKQSLQINGALNGHYCEGKPFLVPVDLKNKTCSAKISYTGIGGYNAHFTVYNNAGEINTTLRAPFVVDENERRTLTIAGFPCGDNTLKWRIDFTGTTNNLTIDKIEINLAQFNEVPNVTTWKPYTPTFQGLGTPTNVEFEWRQVGENVEVRGTLTTGTTTGVEFRLGLPNGYVAATTYTSNSIVGTSTVPASTGSGWANNASLVIDAGAAFVGASVGGTANPLSARVSGSNIAFSGYKASFKFSVKVQGLTNSSTVINAECPDQYACVDTFTAKVTTPTTISDPNVAGWLSSVTRPTTGNYTNTFKAGLFSIPPTCFLTVKDMGSGYDAECKVNTVSTSEVKVYCSNSSTAENHNYNLSCTRSGSDFKGKRVLQAELVKNKVTIKKLPSNLTTTTTNISSLAMSNLIVGKNYKVTVSAMFQQPPGNTLGFNDLVAVHNGNPITIAQTFTSGAAYSEISAGRREATVYFTATTNTLTFNFTRNGSGTLGGNGTAEQTFVMLEEANNYEIGSFF